MSAISTWRLVASTTLAKIAMTSCAPPDTPAPKDARADVSFADPLPEVDAELRYAVLWLQQDPTRVLRSDGGVVDGESFEVKLDLPRGVNLERLAPVESVIIVYVQSAERTPGGTITGPLVLQVDSYRPRIVVYADVDADGELLFDETDASLDRIISADRNAGFTALLDPQAALRAMTLEQAARFYAINDEFTRFVFADGLGGSLTMSEPGTTTLHAAGHERQRANILCGRNVATEPQRPTTTSLYVDTRLDLDAQCASVSAECRSTPLAEFSPPSIRSTLERSRQAQCRRNDDQEALLVHTAHETCSGCACGVDRTIDVYVAARASTPAWWPCGDEVGYCLGAGSFAFFDFACQLDTDAGASRPPEGNPSPDAGRIDLLADGG